MKEHRVGAREVKAFVRVVAEQNIHDAFAISDSAGILGVEVITALSLDPAGLYNQTYDRCAQYLVQKVLGGIIHFDPTNYPTVTYLDRQHQTVRLLQHKEKPANASADWFHPDHELIGDMRIQSSIDGIGTRIVGDVLCNSIFEGTRLVYLEIAPELRAMRTKYTAGEFFQWHFPEIMRNVSYLLREEKIA